MKQGVLYALAAYVAWGFLPMYWKLFQSMAAWEILAHRVIWSFVFVIVLLIVQKRFAQLKPSLAGRRKKLAVLLSSVFISANWLTYIWAVNSGHIVEASLGYYMNPLLNVLIGVLFLGERLRMGQWISILLAFIGVTFLTFHYGRIPWIALSLALSFGLYGLSKKKVQMDSMLSLAWETIIVVPVSLVYLIWLTLSGGSHIQSLSSVELISLLLAGVATALPLFWFAQAAKRLSLSTVGFIQYLSPSISLLLGVLVYHEAFTRVHLVSFAFIWSALILYTWSSMKKPQAAKFPKPVARTGR